MQDLTIQSLITAACANPANAVTMAALADRLLEVSPADRVELLTHLAEQAQRLSLYRSGTTRTLESDKNGRILHAEVEACDEQGDRASMALAQEKVRAEVASLLSKALEDNRWYAVRFAPAANRRSGGRGYRPTAAVRFVANVVPLDGGRVRDVT